MAGFPAKTTQVRIMEGGEPPIPVPGTTPQPPQQVPAPMSESMPYLQHASGPLPQGLAAGLTNQARREAKTPRLPGY